jgi:serine/threonine-protein kinase
VEEGTQVGAYRVLRLLGEGGMGSVWLAEHTMLQRRAAIKVLHPELSSRSEFVTRFFNEARAATSIGDPGIVQVFDFGHHADGSAYIVMELLDGESLGQRLARQGALEPSAALRVMRQIASTLGTAHAQGIVHRDLKPENIYIVRDREVAGGERAKVLDFGIAKLTIEPRGVKTNTKALMGTPRYMSPEQCRGAGLVDQRSDIYALGCMLFTLLVGRPPFESEGDGELIAMHLREPPPVPSSLRAGIPPNIDRLVLRCLAKDPAQRFNHGGELADALDHLLASTPEAGRLGPSAPYTAPAVTTMSASSGASLATPTTRSRRTLMFAALGAVAGGAVAVAVAMTRGGSAPSSSDPGAVSTPAPQVAMAPAAAVPPPPPPKEPEPKAQVAARMKDVMTRFAAWSRDHRGASCPDVTALGDPPDDPWGHAFRLTCTAQPDDQIVGVISAGPDGAPDTADDLASWALGRDVSELVHGPRWSASRAEAKPRLEAKPKPEPKPKQPKLEPKAQPKLEPKAQPAPQPEAGPKVEYDENGIPIKR